MKDISEIARNGNWHAKQILYTMTRTIFDIFVLLYSQYLTFHEPLNIDYPSGQYALYRDIICLLLLTSDNIGVQRTGRNVSRLVNGRYTGATAAAYTDIVANIYVFTAYLAGSFVYVLIKW
jgi:hypothetical protein